MTVEKIHESTGMPWEEIRTISEELADDGLIQVLENSSVLIVAPVCTCPREGDTYVRACVARTGARTGGIATTTTKQGRSSHGRTSYGRDKSRQDQDPTEFDLPVEEWAPKTFARFLAVEINRKYRWGNGVGPKPVNFNATAMHIREWINGGTAPEIIRRMIELFAADPRPYLRSGSPAWQGFIGGRQKLWEKAQRSVRSRQMAQYGNDKDFLEGKGAWARPPAYGPEWDDKDFLEGRKR